MGICAFFVGMGISWATMCPPPPPPPDLAAIELREMRNDVKRQERQAEEKLDWFYGRKPKPEQESIRQ